MSLFDLKCKPYQTKPHTTVLKIEEQYHVSNIICFDRGGEGFKMNFPLRDIPSSLHPAYPIQRQIISYFIVELWEEALKIIYNV